MAANFITPSELVQESSDHEIHDQNHIAAVFNCTVSSLTDLREHFDKFQRPWRSGQQLARNCPTMHVTSSIPTSGASSSFKWCLTSSDSSGFLQFSVSSDKNKPVEDSDLGQKMLKHRPGCKRKLAEPHSAVSEVPTKIFINEKQISSCLSRLTLDNNNLDSHPDFEEEAWFDFQMTPRRSKSELSFNSLLDEVSSNTSSKLVLCRELQLGLDKRTVYPDLVDHEIGKSLMQVVLWKPPGDLIKHVLENLRDRSRRIVSRRSIVTGNDSLIKCEPSASPVKMLECYMPDASKLCPENAPRKIVKGMQDMDVDPS